MSTVSGSVTVGSEIIPATATVTLPPRTGLPPGITLSREGVWGGVPAASSVGDWLVPVTVTDANGNSATKVFQLTILPSATARKRGWFRRAARAIAGRR